MSEQHEGSSAERAPLHAHSGASIVKQAQIVESGSASGLYRANLLRVKKGCEGAFRPLWDRRNFLERKQHRLFFTVMSAMTFGRALSSLLEEKEDLTYKMRQHQFVAWDEAFENTVATVGKNLALDTFLAGSSYTVVGPYMGLISSVSWSATAAADTMTSHAGWLEAGVTNAPTYTTPRKTAAWSAASAGSKALSAALAFAITGSGTIKGAFLVYGTGALTTIDNTAGTLMSAGVFTGGDKVVVNTDTVNVSYSLAV